MADGDYPSKPVILILAAFVVGVLALALAMPNIETEQAINDSPAPHRPIQPEAPQPGPGETDALPPVTAQYVAVAMRGPAYSDAPHQRIEIMHGERWLREQRTEGESVFVTFQHLQENTWITWVRGADGADKGLAASFERRPATASVTDMFYTNTERTDTALGERCTIWEGDYAFENMRRPYSGWATCITEDGIRLWSRGRDFEGRERVTSRLLSLQRRSLSAAETSPPERLFRWSTWRGDVEATPAHNLSVDLASPRGEAQQGDSETVRQRGTWRYTHSVDGDRRRTWTITGPDILFSYNEWNFHLPARNLGISRGPPQYSARATDVPLLQPPRTETIAGLRCRWFDTLGTSHSSSAACRTDDGLTLAHWSRGDGVRGGDEYFSVRATRISRDPLPAPSLAPPPQAFDWLD
jgi:hypothetical protein